MLKIKVEIVQLKSIKIIIQLLLFLQISAK